MIKIKPIIASACAAFVFSFFTALFSRSGIPVSLLKAVIFAVVFGGLAVGVQVLYGMFLSEGSAPADTAERQPIGGKVDLVVSEEDLPEDKEAPVFFVDGRRVVTDDDVSSKPAQSAKTDSGDGGISAARQNQALAAAEKVREEKAAENIEKKAQDISLAKERASAANESASPSGAAPSFAPINLAAKSASPLVEEAVPNVVPETAAEKKAEAPSGDSELDELPDISGLGMGGGSDRAAAAQDENVIEDSEFAQDGSVKVHRQTELADGKIADVKDAPVMAEAIRTILKKEE